MGGEGWGWSVSCEADRLASDPLFSAKKGVERAFVSWEVSWEVSLLVA